MSRISRKLWVWSTPALIAIALVIQLVPYGRAHVNPPGTREPAWDSSATRDSRNEPASIVIATKRMAGVPRGRAGVVARSTQRHRSSSRPEPSGTGRRREQRMRQKRC